MNNNAFEFINHQSTPQDMYVKEIVILQFTLVVGKTEEGKALLGKLRMPYFRKSTKDGGMFWAPASTGVQYHDKKNYVSMRFNDSFFAEDIETFLNDRSWESRVNPNATPSALPQPIQGQSKQPQNKEDELPF